MDMFRRMGLTGLATCVAGGLAVSASADSVESFESGTPGVFDAIGNVSVTDRFETPRQAAGDFFFEATDGQQFAVIDNAGGVAPGVA